jgi:hypothetical protein
MTAARYDITITQGGSVYQVWTWLESDGLTPVDLNGYTAHMQVRDAYGPSGDLLADYSTTAGTLAANATAGTLTWTLTPDVTAAYTWTDGWYDLHVADSGGNVTALLNGIFSITPAITVD